MKRAIAAAALLCALGLAGCGGRLVVDEALVGTWHWTEDAQWRYVFNSDGTGQRGEAVRQAFAWGARGGRLVLDFGPEYARDEYAFALDGSFLSLSSDDWSYTYFMSQPDTELFGTWAMRGSYLVEVVFEPGGTGYAEGLLSEADPLRFSWHTSGGLLVMGFGNGEQRSMAYSIDPDPGSGVSALNVASGGGASLQFLRGAFAQNPALLGAWVWDGNEYGDWVYSFETGGFGERGWIYERRPIVWTTLGGTLFIICLEDLAIEEWAFSISDNALHLSGAGGLSYRYVRGE